MKRILYIVSALTLLSAASLSAQGVEDALRLSLPGLSPNARALGMGNSFVGLSDDASAMFFNPAGLGLVRKMEFAGSFDHDRVNNTTTFFRSSQDATNSSTQISQASFVFPFPTLRGSLVFGLGFNRSANFNGGYKFKGFNANDNSLIQYLSDSVGIIYDLYLNNANGNTLINGRLQQSGELVQSGDLNQWSFTGAIEVEKNFFLGATLNLVSGNFEYTRDYYEDDVQGVYTNVQLANGYAFTKGFKTFYQQNYYKWDIDGYDLKLGALYQMDKFARFGATIQFPRKVTVKENFAPDAYAQFATKTVNLERANYEDEVEYSVVSPYTFELGGAVSYMGLVATGSLSLADYSQTKFEDAKGLSLSYVAEKNKEIKSSLSDVTNYGFGLEYTVPVVNIRVRGGYSVFQSPYKDDPTEFDKKYLTGGFGFIVNNTITLDFGYAHGTWKTFGDNYGSNLSRVYQDVTNNKLLISFGYRF